MNYRVIIFLIAIVVFPLGILSQTPSTTQPQKKIALVIGNGNYNSSILPNPESDARAMKVALESVGFSVKEYENLGQTQMKKAIDEFGLNLKGNDVGLFFYAGHGIQSKGYNYLIPVDAELKSEEDVEYNCVEANRVLAKMEASGSRVNIVILDACRNNPFERSWTRAGNGRGLAFMDAPSGTLIAYSTAPGKTASDGSGSNSPYTSAILECIKTPNITIETMFKNVRNIVSRKSNNQQTPWESTSMTGDFYFNLGNQISSNPTETNIPNTKNQNGLKSKPVELTKNTPVTKDILEKNKPVPLVILKSINDWKVEGISANIKSQTIKKFVSSQYSSGYKTVFDDRGFIIEKVNIDSNDVEGFKKIPVKENGKIVYWGWNFPTSGNNPDKDLYKRKWISDSIYIEKSAPTKTNNVTYFSTDTLILENGRVFKRIQTTTKIATIIPKKGKNIAVDSTFTRNEYKYSYNSEGLLIGYSKVVGQESRQIEKYIYLEFDINKNWTKRKIYVAPDFLNPAYTEIAEYRYY